MPAEPEQKTESVEPPDRPPWEEVRGHLDHYLRESPEVREELRSHEVVAGIAGEIGQRLAKTQLQQQRTEPAEKASDDALQAQLKLAEEDADAFAAQFTSETRAKIARQELQQIASKERKTLTEHIGRAMNDLPEWRELTRDDMAELAQAVSGVPDDQIFGAWIAKGTELVARKRAGKETEARLTERLKSEREAWDTEQAATKVKATPAPNLRSGNAAGTDSGEPPVGTPAWDEWYETRHRLTRARSRAG